MQIVTLDFETYYDKAYSLSKISTQDYIMAPEFEALMVGIKVDNQPTVVYDAPDIAAALAAIDWGNTALVAHNAVFDAAILFWRYGHRPAVLVDTMSMAQALGVTLLTGSASLASCARLLQEAGVSVPPKGDEVVNALGKRAAHFLPHEWQAYRSYCATDVDITYAVYCYLRPILPDAEMEYQDMILRCYTEPMFQVHAPTVQYELERTRKYKSDQLAAACQRLGTTESELAGVLRSNQQFASLLSSLGGVTESEMAAGKPGQFLIPEKVSATTGKTTWAFGKTDVGFKELCESELPMVQAVCQARLAAKSTIDETRCEYFLRVAATGFMPIGYKISGAHTGRLSGGSANSLNMQNMPSGRRAGQTDLLRRSICAPAGHVTVGYDSSQIELRVNAYVAGQAEKLALFATGGDPYSYMAAEMYGLPYSEVYGRAKGVNGYEKDPEADKMRQFGKTIELACIAQGTEVLTSRGWIPIEELRDTDRVFDGHHFVSHGGLVERGERDCMTFAGVWMTPDHKVFDGAYWDDAAAADVERCTAYAARLLGGL